MKKEITFSFGRNWQDFLQNLTETKIKNATESLLDFLRVRDLKGKSFLDIGCGSSIFSYAAFGLGADKITSFDIDPFSVDCCRYLHTRAGNPDNWKVLHGSILDDQFVPGLGGYDIVYSWGVLHHTGRMWDAIKRSAKLVNKNGYYYIAIYNKMRNELGSDFWLRIKKFYNRYPLLGKYILEPIYMSVFFIRDIIRLKNPLRKVKSYKQVRGMEWRTDIRDWLGGYPYEFATVEEVVGFMRSQFPDIKLVKVESCTGLGNNSFLFKKD